MIFNLIEIQKDYQQRGGGSKVAKCAKCNNDTVLLNTVYHTLNGTVVVDLPLCSSCRDTIIHYYPQNIKVIK